MENKTLSNRKELIRKYAQLIFTKGSYFEQIEFLKQYNEKRFLHWDFDNIIYILDQHQNINSIDQSIENIKELNKQIFPQYSKENNFNVNDLQNLLDNDNI